MNPERRTCRRLLPSLVVLGLVPGVAPGQGSPLFVLDLPGTPVGEFPASLKLLSGTLEVALKDGVPMLKATAPSEFLITLPQVLPEAFTLAFDLVPKACCNPDDLAFEGTPTQNRGPASAHVVWDGGGHLMVVGGGEMYQGDMPEELAATLPGVLTSVVAVVEGTTLRLYTNGRRLYTLTDRRFVRGRVLRVSLGGTGEGSNAVYLAGLRITAGAGGPGIVAAEAGLPTRGQTPSRQPPPPPAIESQSQAASGGQARVVSVSVTQGTTGPLVTWTRLGGATSYTVRRWKSDDPTCCNATSPTLSEVSWQDGLLPAAGTYVFEVTARLPSGIATGQAQFVQFAARGRIASVAPTDSGAAGTILAPRSPGATASPATGGNPAGAGAATLFAPPAPRIIALSAISAAGLPRPSVPAARTINLAAITATGGRGSAVSPPPRTIALGTLIATGALIAVRAPTGAIAGLPGTNEGSAAPRPRTIPLAGITGSGGSDMARVPVARSIALGAFSAAGKGERTVEIPPRTIALPAVTAAGSGKTP